jgi:hypothetical protein
MSETIWAALLHFGFNMWFDHPVEKSNDFLPEYYRVCEDVIAEIGEIFDTPRFFHLGYDEENWKCQRLSDFAVVRQGDQWWHDFLI